VRTARDQVLAFRLRRQHLDRRLPADALADMVAAGGIRNTPAGSAPAALAARLTGLDPGTVPAALADGSLVEVLGPRQVPTLVLPADVTVFTAGAMPAQEAALRDALGENAAKALAAGGIGLADAVRLVAEAARQELAAGPRTRGSLSAALTRRLPDALSSWCRRCGSTHLHETLFRTAGGTGAFRMHPGPGRETILAALDGIRPSPAARLDLVRRFLRCHGPAAPDDFAGWTNTGPAEARARWADLADELTPVDWDGRTGSILTEDADRLRRGRLPSGVRLLPPNDPYLLTRDRATTVPDRARRALLWPSIGAPGAVLVDGEISGIWRAQKKSSTLRLELEEFRPLSPAERSDVDTEAAILAPHRGCASAAVAY
jgi:Winged helix DNA-binding domain